jgi:ubiquinone/menaquinone biosynthesis C-methylase UbiE
MSENTTDNAIDALSSPEMYVTALELNNTITEKAIREAIASLGLFAGVKILDVPCGIGNHSVWMAEAQTGINVLGLDIADAHLVYARNLASHKALNGAVMFEKGDITRLAQGDNSFDFVWCCDGLWLGPPETGCIVTEPYGVLSEFKRVLKPGGKIALLFGTMPRLLPGYPLLEAALNATQAANRPITWDSEPESHTMRALAWLEQAGFRNVKVRSFVADIQGPFSESEETALLGAMNMYWGNAKDEVTPNLWQQYERLTDPDSDTFILRQRGYAGYMVYTMFTGDVTL